MAPGGSSLNVSPSNAGGKTTLAPSAASHAAANAGSGAKTSRDGTRSLAHFHRQAASSASGVASAMASNVPSLISNLATHASLQSRHLHLRSPNRQEIGRLQRHEAEEHRAQSNRQHENLAMSCNWHAQGQRCILAECLAKHHEHVSAREQAT